MSTSAFADPRSLVRSCARKALYLPPRRHCDEWAEHNIIIPRSVTGVGGRFSLRYAPYLRAILRDVSDPGVRRITFMAGSQVGKTLFEMVAILYFVDQDPDRTIMVTATRSLAEDIRRERLMPLVHASAVVAERFMAGKKDQRAGQLRFDRMTLHLVGSNAPAELKSRPCRNVIGDEIDSEDFAADARELAEERAKSFPDQRLINASTPGLPGNGTDKLYALSDQGLYYVPCPHEGCGAYQTLVFDRLKWEGGRHADLYTVRQTAWYVCERCGGVIENHQKPAMLLRGQWVRKGEVIGDDGLVRRTPEYRPTDHRGYRLSSLYSPELSFGAVAEQFLMNGCSMRQHFVNNWLAQAYEPESLGAHEHEVVTTFLPIDHPEGYLLKTVPVVMSEPDLAPITLVATVDVQRDHAFYLVRGYSAHGRRSWLIDYGRLAAPADDLRGFERSMLSLAARTYPMMPGHPLRVDEGGKANTTLPITLTGIDSGHRKDEVYRLCALHPRLFVPVKGEGEGQIQWNVPSRWTDAAQKPIGGERADMVEREGAGVGGQGHLEPVRLLLINTPHYKDVVSQRLRTAIRHSAGVRSGDLGENRRGGEDAGEARRREEGEDDQITVLWRNPAHRDRVGNVWEFSAYTSQVTSERLTPVIDKTGKRRPRWVWKQRISGAANHMLDCEVYNAALADAFEVSELTLLAAKVSLGLG